MKVKTQVKNIAIGFFVILFVLATFFVLLPSFSRVFVDYGKPKKAEWLRPEKQQGIILEYEGYSESLYKPSDWFGWEEYFSLWEILFNALFWAVIAIFWLTIIKWDEPNLDWLLYIFSSSKCPFF